MRVSGLHTLLLLVELSRADQHMRLCCPFRVGCFAGRPYRFTSDASMEPAQGSFILLARSTFTSAASMEPAQGSFILLARCGQPELCCLKVFVLSDCGTTRSSFHE